MTPIDWSSFLLGVAATYGLSLAGVIAYALFAPRERLELTDTDRAWLKAAGEWREGL